MAQTDQKAGFRLPWNSDQRSRNDEPATDDSAPSADQADQTNDAAARVQPASEIEGITDSDTAVDQGASASDGQQTDGAAETDAAQSNATETIVSAEATAETAPPTSASGRKPTKFMADLARAMHVAAESARSQTLTQFQTEAKAFIEDIHARSATEATDLRKQADDDVAGIREWSKAEIARIREETEGRISGRKTELEQQLEHHAGVIERRIDRVQGRVSGFETEMAQFFERLLSEEDPSVFATMAQSLPEPPPFEALDFDDGGDYDTGPSLTATRASEATDEGASAHAETATDEGADAAAAVGETATVNETETMAEGSSPAEGEVADGDAAEGSSEAVAETETGEAVAATTEGSDEAPVEASAEESVDPNSDDILIGTDEEDPRLAALGLSDFDTAEAEAAAGAADQDHTSDEEIPTIGDDALAARLNGLVPAKHEDETGKPAKAAGETTQVVVVGLVSVASIASFKRHLGRVSGVQSVGVSSGPDGEFLFAVNHAQDITLREVIPGLPGFQARVTNAGDGIVNVTAHDPESEG